MKISFDSRDEIRKLTGIIESTYPADLVIDEDDLLDAKAGHTNCKLPWNWDGRHLNLRFAETRKKPDRLYRFDEVFRRGEVWEEVERDGKTYLHVVASGDKISTSEEELAYLGGMLEGMFRLVNAGKCSMSDISDLTGQMEQYLVDLCHIWGRRYASDLDD